MSALMVMQVLWGFMTPQSCQHIMSLFCEDLLAHGDGHLDINSVEALGGLGSKGRYPQNVWRDFKACLPQPRLPKLHWMWLPMTQCAW